MMYFTERVHFILCISITALFFSSMVSGHVVAAEPSNVEIARKAVQKAGEKGEKGVTDPLTGTHLYWRDGLNIEGRYEKLEFNLGGSVMVDAGSIDADHELQRAFSGLDGSDVHFRKLLVEIRGTFFDALDFRLGIDFANVRDIKDNWIRFKNVPILDHMKFGHLKDPVSLEQMISINNITFMELALPVVALTPGRNIGIRYDRGLLEERMTLALGGFLATGSFNDLGEGTDQLSEATGYNLTTRLTYLPLLSDNGTRLLHLGLSYSHMFRDDSDQGSTDAARTRPETRITDERLVDTGELVTGGGDRIGVELACISGPLSLQGEYLHSWSDTGDQLSFWGYYLYASYVLTGESRGYDRKQGRLTGIKPAHEFRLRRGGWGAWELGLRTSYVDLNDGHIKGGKEWNVTAGLNWYLNPKTRFMFNYIWANVEDRQSPPAVHDSSANIFQARFQLAF